MFCNLTDRNPGGHDRLLQECIGRVNLDALWGREQATVEVTAYAVHQTVTMLWWVNVPPPYPPLGPYALSDTMGYSIAIAMVLKSRE